MNYPQPRDNPAPPLRRRASLVIIAVIILLAVDPALLHTLTQALVGLLLSAATLVLGSAGTVRREQPAS